MYRRIQDTQNTMEALHEHMRAALLSQNTRDAIGHAGAVQEASAMVLHQLENSQKEGSTGAFGGRDIDPAIVRSAIRAMNLAIENSERVALGSNIDEMRDRLIDVKTQIDYADAYLRVAIGHENP